MSVLTRRGWTAGERALARVVFGTALEGAAVQLFQGPSVSPFGAMVPVRDTIVFGAWRASVDFSRVSLAEQGWFVHELAHVWQARRGTTLALAKLGAIGRRAYRVTADARPFSAFNIEAQAEIARFTFLTRMGAPDPAGPSPAWLESRWPVPPPPSSSRPAWV